MKSINMKIPREKLFPYKIGEDIANSVSHGIGAVIAGILLIQLVYIASTKGDITDVIAFSFYGITLFLMFLMSTLYHGIRHYTTRSIFKRLDHSFVFILILGTYTPFVFSAAKTDLAYIVYGILILITLLGIVFKSLFIGKYNFLATLAYVVMGWLSIILIKQIISSMSTQGVIYLIIGGVVYTIGAFIYALSKFKYHHFVWHIFVLAGALFHYFAVAYYIL
ncbi:hemolysin III family protein [Mycoplasmatota bacterium zrk1]